MKAVGYRVGLQPLLPYPMINRYIQVEMQVIWVAGRVYRAPVRHRYLAMGRSYVSSFHGSRTVTLGSHSAHHPV